MTVATKQIEFEGSLGAGLVGTLELPEGEPAYAAVFAHCFTCSKTSTASARVSAALAREGVAVLRFDFTGLGSSDGDFADTNFTSNVSDLVAAAGWMTAHVGPVELLVGHSLGGAAVIAAAEQLPAVAAVAVLGAPFSPEHVANVITGLPAAPDDGGNHEDDPVAVDIGGRPFRLRPSFLADITESRQRERIENLRRPLLVLHSPTDQTVGIDNARQIFESAQHPKSFVALDGADHLLTRREDADYAAATIAAWATRYAGPTTAQPDPAAVPRDQLGADLSPGEVEVVELSAASGFAHRVRTQTHTWLLDEPESVGGADSGPGPYDQLLAALGACTSMTMRMYARRKGWEYGATRVLLSHDRVHAKDCEACEAETGMVDHLRREIVFDSDLATDQRAALERIADKCPVHRTLTGQVEITTRVR